MQIIHSLKIHGRTVLFYENQDQEVDFCVTDNIPEEEFNSIVHYMLNEGIFEQVFTKEQVDAVIKECSEMEDDCGSGSF